MTGTFRLDAWQLSEGSLELSGVEVAEHGEENTALLLLVEAAEVGREELIDAAVIIQRSW